LPKNSQIRWTCLRLNASGSLARTIATKKMVGGIGFLLNGNMLVGVWKNSLIVRVGPDGYDEALLEAHVKEFDITGKPMRGWVLVEPEGIEDDDQLNAWIKRAVKFVGKLAAK
jgi:TfoX/Sxy family transcriptional regulator of competence genes